MSLESYMNIDANHLRRSLSDESLPPSQRCQCFGYKIIIVWLLACSQWFFL